MSPRSILKHRRGSSQSAPVDSANTPFPFAQCSRAAFETQRVRFPPTPKLTTSQTTHSSTAYDRAPIHVSPNTCALPPRDASNSLQAAKHAYSAVRSYFHPMAYAGCEKEELVRFNDLFLDPPPDSLVVPPLMSDHTSSSSEDTDGPISPFSDTTFPCPSPSDSPIPCKGSAEELDRALSFLPHAPRAMMGSDGHLASFGLSPAPKLPSRRRLRSRATLRSSSFLAVGEYFEDGGCLGGF